jgi:hypothetical protein
MNHQKVYDNIIENAKFENRTKHNGTYYENHHILPKCLSGIDDEINRVLLTFKEHFVCHKLLTFIYPHDRKIACAYHKMAYSNHKNCHISVREYVYARELISKIPQSEETRKKISYAVKGEKNGFFNKTHSEETKQKMKKTPQQRDITRKRMTGENNHQWGKIGELSTNWKREFSQQTLENMGKAQKERFSKKENHPRFGKHCSEETKNKIRESLLKRKI